METEMVCTEKGACRIKKRLDATAKVDAATTAAEILYRDRLTLVS